MLLGLRDPVRVLTGFDRPNLRYRVLPVPNDAARLEALQILLERSEFSIRPAIIYADTRSQTEEVAELIRTWGFESAAYHAGLAAEQRNAVQDAFLADRVQIIVATSAFGSTCRNKISPFPTPSARAERTKSKLRARRTSARTRPTRLIQLKSSKKPKSTQKVVRTMLDKMISGYKMGMPPQISIKR